MRSTTRTAVRVVAAAAVVLGLGVGPGTTSAVAGSGTRPGTVPPGHPALTLTCEPLGTVTVWDSPPGSLGAALQVGESRTVLIADTLLVSGDDLTTGTRYFEGHFDIGHGSAHPRQETERCAWSVTGHYLELFPGNPLPNGVAASDTVLV